MCAKGYGKLGRNALVSMEQLGYGSSTSSLILCTCCQSYHEIEYVVAEICQYQNEWLFKLVRVFYTCERRGALLGSLNTILFRSQPTSSNSRTNESNCCCIVCRLLINLLPCPRRLTTLFSSVHIISSEFSLMFSSRPLSKKACISSPFCKFGSNSRLAWYMLRNIVRLEQSSCKDKVQSQNNQSTFHPPNVQKSTATYMKTPFCNMANAASK